MLTLITVIHILVSIVLIGLVLLQDSKGGALGGLGVGNANSVLGATGGADLATKMTRIAAIVFAATSISLAVLSSKSNRSVVDDAVKRDGPAPVAPLNPDASQEKPAEQSQEPPTQQ